MTPSEPRTREHGTKARYHIDACRCEPCTTAANEYGQHRARQMAYGRWQPYVDAEEARQHVLALRAAGMGPVTIGRRAGVPHGGLAKLIYGDPARGMAPSRRIRRETAERLLSVRATLDNLAPGALVPGIGTRRRAQALLALGWSFSEQARRVGSSPALYHRSINSERVTADRARRVRDMYEALSMTPGPSSRARSHADQSGYAPPLAWDDETIDDPTADPVGVGFTREPSRADTLAELDHRGAGVSEACRVLRVSRDALERWCQRHDLAAVYCRMSGREDGMANERLHGGVA